jgi:hypothetical protein
MACQRGVVRSEVNSQGACRGTVTGPAYRDGEAGSYWNDGARSVIRSQFDLAPEAAIDALRRGRSIASFTVNANGRRVMCAAR